MTVDLEQYRSLRRHLSRNGHPACGQVDSYGNTLRGRLVDAAELRRLERLACSKCLRWLASNPGGGDTAPAVDARQLALPEL